MFHSFQCFHVSFFAHCIWAMYMFILPTKVKSMSIECIISMIYNLIDARALYFPPLMFQSWYIQVRITDPSPANQFYEWICREYYAWMYIVPQKFGAKVVFCTREVFIEIRIYHDYRLCTCALIRAVVQNVSSVFVRNSSRLLRHFAEVLASDR